MRIKRSSIPTLKLRSGPRCLLRLAHNRTYGGGEAHSFGILKILGRFLKNLEVEVGPGGVALSEVFGMKGLSYRPKRGGQYDLFINISHFTLPEPVARKNVAVIFYPQYDWSEGIKKYDKVVANSGFTAEQIELKWGVRADVIEPSMEIDQIIEAAKCYEKKNQILSIGRFFWIEDGNNKNQEILAQAFRKMPEGWKLVFVGTVQQKDYFQRVKRVAEGQAIEFKYNISYDELLKLYGESKILWHGAGYGARYPSNYEHFGMIAVEALAANCRALVYDGGGIARIEGVETWNTTDELIAKTLEDKPVDLSKFALPYGPDKIAEKWKDLILALGASVSL